MSQCEPIRVPECAHYVRDAPTVSRVHDFWIDPVMALSDVREWLKHCAPTVSVPSHSENDVSPDLLRPHSLGSAGLTRLIAAHCPGQPPRGGWLQLPLKPSMCELD